MAYFARELPFRVYLDDTETNRLTAASADEMNIRDDAFFDHRSNAMSL
jgi:hypothetical protein